MISSGVIVPGPSGGGDDLWPCQARIPTNWPSSATKQELDRSLGLFSSFAAGFSYISIMTGVFELFFFGFGSGGPAFIWTWPAVFIGQMLVALCFAELAGQYPLAGSVYQWSKQIARPFTSFFGGWILTVGSIVTLAAVAVAYQVVLPQISAFFEFIGGPADIGLVSTPDGAKNALLLAAGLVVFTTIINMIGVKLMARINNFGVIAELTILGHIQRGGDAVGVRPRAATRFGVAAVASRPRRAFATMVALRSGQIVRVPLAEAVAQSKTVDLDLDRSVAGVFSASSGRQRGREPLGRRSSRPSWPTLAGVVFGGARATGDCQDVRGCDPVTQDVDAELGPGASTVIVGSEVELVAQLRSWASTFPSRSDLSGWVLVSGGGAIGLSDCEECLGRTLSFASPT